MNLLLESLAPDWMVVSFPIVRIVLVCLMFISAIIISITVLLQSDSSSGGTNSITGVQESYYSNNKGASKEGRLKKITIICSIVIAVCIVLYFVSLVVPTA